MLSEKPLLVHGRKFDIRIYFMTFIRENHVDIWVYKNCYIKFSTPPFSLNSLHKSIHVTNYTVQKQFMNPRDVVPNAKENMWPLEEFINHLKWIGKPNAWSEQIYPSIKKNLLAVILASLEVTTLTANNFELNGADFMIGYDYEPILIEVNSAPALYFSKTVQELITHKLLEDIIKVTVDRQMDPDALTGDFELAHTQEIPKLIDGNDLTIFGRKIESHSARIQGRSESRDEKKTKIDVQMNTKTMLEANDRCPIYFKEK